MAWLMEHNCVTGMDRFDHDNVPTAEWPVRTRYRNILWDMPGSRWLFRKERSPRDSEGLEPEVVPPHVPRFGRGIR